MSRLICSESHASRGAVHCTWCRFVIPKGESYRREVWDTYGDISSQRTCQRCQPLLQQYLKECDEFHADEFDEWREGLSNGS